MHVTLAVKESSLSCDLSTLLLAVALYPPRPSSSFSFISFYILKGFLHQLSRLPPSVLRPLPVCQEAFFAYCLWLGAYKNKILYSQLDWCSERFWLAFLLECVLLKDNSQHTFGRRIWRYQLQPACHRCNGAYFTRQKITERPERNPTRKTLLKMVSESCWLKVLSTNHQFSQAYSRSKRIV